MLTFSKVFINHVSIGLARSMLTFPKDFINHVSIGLARSILTFSNVLIQSPQYGFNFGLTWYNTISTLVHDFNLLQQFVSEHFDLLV